MSSKTTQEKRQTGSNIMPGWLCIFSSHAKVAHNKPHKGDAAPEKHSSTVLLVTEHSITKDLGNSYWPELKRGSLTPSEAAHDGVTRPLNDVPG